MPELPDITVYIEALNARTRGRTLEKIRLSSPFVLRSFDPPISSAEGKRVIGFERLGKRIVFCLEEELFLIIHLMIAGRLRWKPRGAAVTGKIGLAAFDFPDGTLMLTEASTKKRASIYLVRGRAAMQAHQPGGLEIFDADAKAFGAALRRENRTLKRALTDPRLISGIGNAYSDEILHRARLSPVRLTGKLSDAEIATLFEATRSTMNEWIKRLREQTGGEFPEEVTAFQPEMAVHGKFGKPCPVCATPVQHIVYAANECNYCPRCQTGGKLLADRSLSRLLKKDWPKTLEELEEKKAELRSAVPAEPKPQRKSRPRQRSL